jgi:vacuolar-type H+-ATPase subunit E/Vma4
MSDDLTEYCIRAHNAEADLGLAQHRIEQLEARVSDAEADALRLLREKQDMFLRAIKAEAQLAAAREALQATRDDLVTYGLDDFDGTTKEAIDRIDAILSLTKPRGEPAREGGQ